MAEKQSRATNNEQTINLAKKKLKITLSQCTQVRKKSFGNYLLVLIFSNSSIADSQILHGLN